MLKAVLDTNLIVSGAISSRSSPHELLEAWRRSDFALVISPPIVAEVTEVLARDRVRVRYRITAERAAALRHSLETEALMVMPERTIQAVPGDSDDDRILECAVAGQADYIVTGDHHLLGMHQFEGIPIVTAAEFLAVLDARPA